MLAPWMCKGRGDRAPTYSYVDQAPRRRGVELARLHRDLDLHIRMSIKPLVGVYGYTPLMIFDNRNRYPEGHGVAMLGYATACPDHDRL